MGDPYDSDFAFVLDLNRVVFFYYDIFDISITISQNREEFIEEINRSFSSKGDIHNKGYLILLLGDNLVVH